MVALLTTFHVLVAVILILVVLVQSSRGTDIAAAFGGMGSQAAFGPRGTATFLSKATVVLAILFMVTSLSLAIMSSRPQGGGGESVLGDQPAATETQPSPPTPAAPPAGPATTAPAATPGTPSVMVETVPAPTPTPAPAAAPPSGP